MSPAKEQRTEIGGGKGKVNQSRGKKHTNRKTPQTLGLQSPPLKTTQAYVIASSRDLITVVKATLFTPAGRGRAKWPGVVMS